MRGEGRGRENRRRTLAAADERMDERDDAMVGSLVKNVRGRHGLELLAIYKGEYDETEIEVESWNMQDTSISFLLDLLSAAILPANIWKI